MAFEGIVVVAVDVMRPKGSTAAAAYSAVGGGGSGAGVPGGLTSRARITTRGMWTNNGRLLEVLHKVGLGMGRCVGSTVLFLVA